MPVETRPGLLLALLASMQALPAARAEEPAATAPVPEIPVGGETEVVLPEPSTLQWNVVGDLQGDAAVATSVQNEVREVELRRARIALVVDWLFDFRFKAS